jgi:hypothetical protein
MAGSPAAAALIAHVAFWTLLIFGWALGELNLKRVAIFLLAWLLAFIGLPKLPHGGALVPSFVAVLDVTLVLLIFKGDVRL